MKLQTTESIRQNFSSIIFAIYSSLSLLSFSFSHSPEERKQKLFTLVHEYRSLDQNITHDNYHLINYSNELAKALKTTIPINVST